MANVTVRTTGLGTLTTVGQFDEVTFANTGLVGIKNLINSSQNLLAGNWGFSYSEIITPQLFTAPDGTLTANQMCEIAQNNSHQIGNEGPAYAVGQPYTWSVYLKKGVLSTAPDWIQLGGYFLNFNSAYANFNLTTGQVGYTGGSVGAAMTYVANGWWRCSITVIDTQYTPTGWMWIAFTNNNNANSRFPSYLGSPTSDVLIWGAQLEQSLTPTSYQPTNVAGTTITPVWAQKYAPEAVYTTGDLDEVTYNVNSGVTKNLLVNSNWLGGTSGAWGGGSATLPTGFVGIPTYGAVTYAPAQSGTGNSITFFGTQSRDYISQYPAFNIAPNTNYVFSVQIEAITVPEQPADIFIIVGSYQYNFNYSFYLNGVSVYAYTPLTTPGLLSVVFSNPGYISASSFTALMRVGFGTSGFDAAGGIRLANPQVEVGSTPTIYQPTTATGTAPVAFARRDTAQGNIFVGGSFDEVSGGMNSVTNGLVYLIDPAKPESYPGTGTAITDLSGTYPTSTLSGGFKYTSDYGGIWRLDGSGTAAVGGQTGTGYINTNIPFYANQPLDIVNPAFTLTSNFTWSVWCRFEKNITFVEPGPNAAVGGIIGADYFGGVALLWQSDANGNIIGTTGSYSGVAAAVRTYQKSISTSFDVGTNYLQNLQLGFWYNFTLVYTSSGQFSYYYNTPTGTILQSSVAQANFTGGYTNNIPSTIGIGRSEVDGSGGDGLIRQTFPGSIGLCRIYNRALNLAEITQNFQDTQRRYGV